MNCCEHLTMVRTYSFHLTVFWCQTSSSPHSFLILSFLGSSDHLHFSLSLVVQRTKLKVLCLLGNHFTYL